MSPSETIKDGRKALGLTAERFAVILGVTVRTVRRWEGGHTTPSDSVLALLETLQKAAEEEEASDV